MRRRRQKLELASLGVETPRAALANEPATHSRLTTIKPQVTQIPRKLCDVHATSSYLHDFIGKTA